MNLDNVNKRNSREWSLFNENSRGENNRARFVEKYGGEFVKINKSWVWNSRVKKKMDFAHTKKKRTIYIFTDKDGIKYITDNFTSFCKDRNINDAAMYDVINGKRKSFKGFTVERIQSKDQA